MERLKPFLHRAVDPAVLGDPTALAAHECRGRWIPDPIEDFDEAEIALPLTPERDLVVTLALERQRLERMMLGWAPAGDDDADARALDAADLATALEASGARLVRLLDALFPTEASAKSS